MVSSSSESVPATGTVQSVQSKYRPDIDGLRAVAVLAVVAFHAAPSRVAGGFVGVDVFFVVSGFLIFGIIYDALRQERFSLLEFYIRRVRRIFPALVLVLGVTLAAGWFALLPDEYEQLGSHVAGGAGFVSNFVLWKESGYFDRIAETKPLLHLWSLGIEEQFYLAFPLLVWLAWRRLNLFIAVVVLGSLSFAWNIQTHGVDVVAGFYSPLTRAWELMLGAALAYHVRQPEGMNGGPGHVRAILGLALILAAALGLRGSHGYPGWWALLPTAGTVLLVSAGPAAWVNRSLLSHRLLVWVGLISFPLYLWHWVLLAFARIFVGTTPPRSIRAAAVVVSIGLAWLTYRFVERPLRFGRYGALKALALVAAMGVVGASGYLTFRLHGIPARSVEARSGFDGDIGSDVFFATLQRLYKPCEPAAIRDRALPFKGVPRCFQSKPGTTQDVAIVGDSHAEHLFPGVAAVLPGKNVVYLIEDSMPYVRNDPFRRLFDYVLGNADIHAVILSAYWVPRMGDLPKTLSAAEEMKITVRQLLEAGKDVYIISDAPRFSFDPRKCKYSNVLSPDFQCSESSEATRRENATFGAVLDAIRADSPQVRITLAEPHFCAGETCSMVRGSTLLYRDFHHLNVEGSTYLAEQIVREHPELAREVRGQPRDSRSGH